VVDDEPPPQPVVTTAKATVVRAKREREVRTFMATALQQATRHCTSLQNSHTSAANL
jgi:hypothetical protein